MPGVLLWLALGTFAIGTEGFMIAGLLTGIAQDLQVTVIAAGQLVAVFSFAYALGSPLLAVATAGWRRRRVLLVALIGFGCANLLAALAPSYGALMAVRVLLAFSAALYVPAASAFAGLLVEPARRGRAIAVISSGLSCAMALGAPLGTMLGQAMGWRSTFLAVAVITLPACIALYLALPRPASEPPVPGLVARVAVARRPAILLSLLVTLCWISGVFALFTYVADYMGQIAGFGSVGVTLALFFNGLGAVTGTTSSGRAVDRFGPNRVIAASLVPLGLCFVFFAILPLLTPSVFSPQLAGVLALIVTLPWSAAAWMIGPALTARLIVISGAETAGIAISLNSSALYLGAGLGAALGGLVLPLGGPAALGVVGVVTTLAGRLVLVLAKRRQPAATQGML